MRCLECIYCERFDLRTSPPTVICSSHNAPINIHLGCRNGKNKLAQKRAYKPKQWGLCYPKRKKATANGN